MTLTILTEILLGFFSSFQAVSDVLLGNNYLESRSREISYMKYIKERRAGLATFCVETAFYNRLLKERYKGGIEVTGRRGRRRRKLLNDLKERRGYSHLKEEALDRTVWRARFGRGFGSVVRQATK
jgi:hypothetical protein